MAEITRATAEENLGVVLVTGGAGFLGSKLVEALLKIGVKRCSHIHVVDLSPWCPSSESVQGKEQRVTSHKIDLRNSEEVSALVQEVRPRCIFHVASAVDVRPIFTRKLWDINVGGTVNVVIAASACKDTKALVYCSTLDVVYSGREMNFVEETLPYTTAENFRWWVPGNYYAPSKARAEQIVLAANGDALKTLALRPGHLFGEGDVILDIFCKTPVTLRQSGYMTMQYTGNAACMHIMAARRLIHEGQAEDFQASTKVSGQAFNMGDFDTPFSDFYGRELQPSLKDHKIPTQLPIPMLLMFLIALCIDAIDFMLDLLGQIITPFAMACRCRSRGKPLKLRLPRHPAICLSTSSVLESSENHRTNRDKCLKCFGFDSFYGEDPSILGNVQLLTRDQSVSRVQTWMKEKLMSPSTRRVNGYNYHG